MAKQAISPGKRRMLSEGFVNKRLLYRRQRSSFVIDLILIVTAKTKLRYSCDQVVIIVRAMRIMAGDAMSLFNGAVDCLCAIRNRVVVTADAQSLRRRL